MDDLIDGLLEAQHIWIAGVVNAVAALDGVADHCPVYAAWKGMVLDTLFGPEDDLDFVPGTTLHN